MFLYEENLDDVLKKLLVNNIIYFNIKTKMMEVFNAKIVEADISNWDWLVAILNDEQAAQFWITAYDKISLIRRWEEYVVDVALSSQVKPWEIGATKELLKAYPFQGWDRVLISFVKSNPLSIQAIRKKLLGKKINKEEIEAIVEDIQNNKLSDLALAYYTATSFFYKADIDELVYTTKATAYTWDMYRFPGIVASKYCIGGVSWNETTMIVVPLLASLGITVPKTFSRSITSPAATGECVDVLMQSELKKADIVRLVEEHGCCLAWNGNLNLAPANDRIIKVSAPIGIEPYARMISSIMAKNYAMWVSHCLIDIPVGPTAKVTNQKDAKKMAKRFKTIGNALGVKTEVTITKAEQPIGNWVGAVLQVREVLRILQQHPERAMDLEEKALDLAAQLLVLCWVSKLYMTAYKLAKEQLVSGKAMEKLRNLIKAQNGKNPDIGSEDLQLAENTFEVRSPVSGKVKAIDMKHLNTVARMLWAPSDATAWVYLCKKLGDKVKEGDVLMICYAYSDSKLAMTKEYLDSGLPYEIK